MLALFAIGAALTALAIHVRGELGPAYLIVLGLEAVLAFIFGATLFGEHPNLGRILGLALLCQRDGPARGLRVLVARFGATTRGHRLTRSGALTTLVPVEPTKRVAQDLGRP